MWANNGGHNKKTETWWINAKGYIEGRIWIDSETQIRVKKHRYLMEQHLGRRLLPSEDVHHLNGNKQDNRIRNLQVIDHGMHTQLSSKSRVYKRGYKLNLTDAERLSRSNRAKAIGLGQKQRQKRKLATGEAE